MFHPFFLAESLPPKKTKIENKIEKAKYTLSEGSQWRSRKEGEGRRNSRACKKYGHQAGMS
jgi:hypothetical protein